MHLQSILPRILASALVALAAPLPAAQTAQQPEPIRVLTCNVRLSTAKDGRDAWAHRRDALADVIARFPDGKGPYDFIGTQETIIHPDPELNQRDFLASKLTDYGVIGRSREKDPDRGEGMVLFWKKDRWRIDPKDYGTFWLSETPGVPGSKVEGASKPRTAAFGLFHEIGARGAPTGRKLYVYDTHLDHISDAARELGAKALLAHIAARNDKSAPVILMGDMNCDEKSTPMRYLLGERVHIDGFRTKPPLALVDTFAVANPGEKETGTFNGFKEPGKKRIDFILVTPDLRTLSSKIIRTKRPDGGYPTDHFPVESVLSWQ